MSGPPESSAESAAAGAPQAPARPLALIANARLPSQRAQSLQVTQVAAAFARAGAPTTLLHARRHPTPKLPPGQDLFDYYNVAPIPAPAVKPTVEAVACVDWIDRVPTRLQYVPARIQELTFARNAARRVRALARERPGLLVLSREAESALSLVRAGFPDVFVEVHRVPGGRSRRRWLLEAAAGARGLVAISGGVREDLVALGVPAGDVRVEHDGFERTAVGGAGASRSAGMEQAADLERAASGDRGELGTEARAKARADLRLDPARPLVVYTGGLLRWKGVEYLVEAARLLPDVQVVIAGGMTADVERLRAFATGPDGKLPANLRLDGFQPPTRIPTYLAAADVGVIPNAKTPAISARYTSPLKAFEAMAAGLPQVVSDLPSLREVFPGTPAESGALRVEPESPAALAEGLRTVIEQPQTHAAMRAALLRRAPEHTWDARAERLLAWMAERSSGALAGGAR